MPLHCENQRSQDCVTRGGVNVEYSLVVHDKLPSTGIIVYYSLVLGKLSARVYHKVQAWCALSPSLTLSKQFPVQAPRLVYDLWARFQHAKGVKHVDWFGKSHMTGVKQNDSRSSSCMWSGAGSLCFCHTVCKWSHDGDMLVGDFGASLGSIIEEALWGQNLIWNYKRDP